VSDVKKIKRQVEQLTHIRDLLNHQIKLLEAEYKRQNGSNYTVRKNGQSYRQVVSRIQFKPYIDRWCDLWELHYDTKGVYVLAEKEHLDPGTIKNIMEKEDQQYVYLETVDLLLQAMERNDILQNLDIINIPWPRKRGGKTVIPEPPPTQYFEE
jgi:hypothetical protein